MSTTLRRLVGGLLVLTAVMLFVLAFTRFDGTGAPPSGPPDPSADEAELMHDARSSVMLGVVGCFVLLGAFACFSRSPRPGAPPGSSR